MAIDLKIYNLFRNNKKNKKGKLICLEGIDGSGKRTQTLKLEKYLKDKGYNVKVISFPIYNEPIGQLISDYLTGEFGDINDVPYKLISLAYSADRAAHTKYIESLINKGYIILSDRYTYSNIFNAAKLDDIEKRKEYIEWNEKIEFEELGVYKPDHNFFLYVDPKISIERIKERGKREYQKGKEDIHEKNSNLLIEATKEYLKLSERDDWTLINQMKNGKQVSEDDIFEMIKKEIDIILK